MDLSITLTMQLGNSGLAEQLGTRIQVSEFVLMIPSADTGSHTRLGL